MGRLSVFVAMVQVGQVRVPVGDCGVDVVVGVATRGHRMAVVVLVVLVVLVVVRV